MQPTIDGRVASIETNPDQFIGGYIIRAHGSTERLDIQGIWGDASYYVSVWPTREAAESFLATRADAQPAESTCPECDGTGGYSPAYVSGGEIIGPDACHRCQGHGTIADAQPGPGSEAASQLQKPARPTWCPHNDCGFKCQTQDALCVGILPKPDPHDGDFNTHRMCWHGAKDDGEWTFDLKINKSDSFHMKRMLDAAFTPAISQGIQDRIEAEQASYEMEIDDAHESDDQ